jgi:hypothetical protein
VVGEGREDISGTAVRRQIGVELTPVVATPCRLTMIDQRCGPDGLTVVAKTAFGY